MASAGPKRDGETAWADIWTAFMEQTVIGPRLRKTETLGTFLLKISLTVLGISSGSRIVDSFYLLCIIEP